MPPIFPIPLQHAQRVPQKMDLNLSIELPLEDGRELAQGPLTYNQDGLATQHNADFMNDPAFMEAYEKVELCERAGFHRKWLLHWRVHLTTWAAHNGKLLGEGDFIECGVAFAATATACMKFIDFKNMPDRHYYLLDTFEGIPQDHLGEDKESFRQEMNTRYPPSYEIVKENVAEYENVTLIKGKVPDTLKECPAEKVAFIHIDMNNVVPEVAAANYFWDKMLPGAIMILDDYGWAGHQEQKAGLDKFAAERGVTIFSCPTGAGILMKPPGV